MPALDEATIKREQAMELTRREMQRKSLDTIRLFNPLDHTFKYKFDGFWHQVPAKGTKDEPRYLARHYFKKIAEYMIGQQQLVKGEELKSLREKQLGRQYLDKYEENREVWDKVPKLDDPNLLREIRAIVILGVVEEYGMELPEETTNEAPRNVDLRNSTDQIFDEDNNMVRDDVPSNEKETTTYPINKYKKENLDPEEVTNAN